MHNSLSHTLLAQISAFVNTRLGLHFPPKRWPDLARGIARAAEDFGFENDAEACIQWLVSSPLTGAQIETLADHLTIGETYFFREKSALDALQNTVLPPLIHARQNGSRQVRLWSAGCCTGEEPYSIAILLDKYFPSLADWKITILASDINPRFLQKARDARYRDWSFRDTPAWVKEQYFTKQDTGEYLLASHIKNRVTFFSLNLIEDTYPSFLNDTVALDVIFCRNVLIYFDQNGIKSVVDRFYRSLAEGGVLVVSSTETSTQYYPQFNPVKMADVVLYQKDKTAAPAPTLSPIPKKQRPTLLPPQAQPPAETPRPSAPQPPAPAPSPTEPPAANAETLYRDALKLYQQGRYPEAITRLQTIAANPGTDNRPRPPFHAEALLLLVKAYANQGQLSEARRWGEQVIAVDKLNPVHYYLLGNILQEQGDINEAIRVFKQALYLEPNFSLAMMALGNLAHQQGKRQEAARHFDNTLRALKNLTPDTVLYGSENMTAGQLTDIIQAMLK